MFDDGPGHLLRPVGKRSLSCKTKLPQVCLEAGFSKLVEVGQCFVNRPTILSEEMDIKAISEKYAQLCDDLRAEPEGVIRDSNQNCANLRRERKTENMVDRASKF